MRRPCTIDDVAGRAKRQVGEWTGDTSAQVEGGAQQIKGKAEKAWGNMKDAARGASHDVRRERDADTHADDRPAAGRP
jgi:uncharacterized protein YjbJ (UPF0337 family)